MIFSKAWMIDRSSKFVYCLFLCLRVVVSAGLELFAEQHNWNTSPQVSQTFLLTGQLISALQIVGSGQFNCFVGS